MACSKYTLTNTGTTSVNFNYQRCDDLMWEYQVNLDPNETKNIWVVDGTYAIAQLFQSSVSVINYGSFPLAPTPTPSNTPTNTPTPSVTPTNTPTPTITETPNVTPTNTPTPTITETPTNTPTPTPTITETPTNTPTPTITETPTNTPTPTPTLTPSPTPFPVSTITLTSSQWAAYSVTNQSSFQTWLQNVNNNPSALVVSGFNYAGNTITAQVQNVRNLLLGNLNFTSIDVVPDGLEVLQIPSTVSTIPTLPSTLKQLNCGSNSNVTTVPTLPSGLTGLTLSQTSNITSIPTLPSSLISLEINGLSSISGLTTLPSTLTYLDIGGCNFTQSGLDTLVTQFLVGTLPKEYWDSTFQITGNTPSGSNQTLLANTSNVTTANYTP